RKKKNDNITNTVDNSATSPLSLRDVFNSKSSTQKFTITKTKAPKNNVQVSILQNQEHQNILTNEVNQDTFHDQVESNITIYNSPVQQLSSKIVKRYPELLLSDKSQLQSTMKTRSVLSESTTNVLSLSSILEASKQQEMTKEIELNNLSAK
ncbi:11809_t:CDS:2, partial [Funneliformis caledonium]